MATQTRARTAGKGAIDSRRTSKAPVIAPEPGFRERLGLAWHEFTSDIPQPRIEHKYGGEVLAAFLLLLAALSSYVLIFDGANGVLMHWWHQALYWFAGKGAFLIPVLLLLAGLRTARQERTPFLLSRHYFGAFLLLASVCGVLAYSGDTTSTGGLLGRAVAGLTAILLSEPISVLILMLTGTAGVFILSGMGLRTFGSEIRRLFPLPHRSEESDAFEMIAAPVARPQLPQQPIQPQLQQTPSMAPITSKALDAKTAADQRSPVINIPKSETPVPVTGEKPTKAVASKVLPLPHVDKLQLYKPVTPDIVELEASAELIEETLASFKVDARVREINPGPAVTQFTLEPGQGVKVSRITALGNDLALALAAPSVRIEAPVPGMARVGIEIPNPVVATVGLRETLESQQFAKNKTKLPIPLGRDVNGRYAIGDLTKMPHLLIAGSTGSGKSVCLNAIVCTFLLTRQPEDVKLIMIDPKMVEMAGYNGVPHLQTPVITEMDKVVSALRLVVAEMQRRYDLFNKNGVRNLDGYRMKIEDEPLAEKVPFLVVIVDELADLMLTSPVEVEGLLQRIAQMGRASGIHLILATQRPSVDVITGVIKANIPSRIAFAVASLADSRVILDMPGAERLIGRGDMLFLPPDAAKPSRIQGAFVEDKDVHYVVNHWHGVAPIPTYSPDWMELQSSHAAAGDFEYEDDPLMERALEIVREQGTASASMLQRRLRIGYNRAARLIEQMEADGVIGPADGVKGRTVLLDVF